MLINLVNQYAAISITDSIIILAILWVSPILNRKYTAKWNCYLWIPLVMQLMIPIPFSVSAIHIHAKVPAWIAAIANSIALGTHTNTFFCIYPSIWLFGVITFLSIQLLKYLTFRRVVLRWGRMPKKSYTKTLLQDLEKEYRIKKNIPVLINSNIRSPCLTGFLWPYIILPHEDFNKQELLLIFQHELIHYQNRDLRYKLLLTLANSLHWFNPFIYWMRKNAAACLEYRCDEQLLDGKDFPYRRFYCELVAAMANQQKQNNLIAYFQGRINMLKRRFTNILKVEKKRSGMAVCLCLVACILFISSSMQAALTRCLHAFTSLNHTQTANADQVHVVDDKEMLPLSAYNLKYSKTSPELHVWAH